MPEGQKLRAKGVTPPFRVVLIEPEIPPNTGAVARTCAATQSELHLVGKLGFRIDEQSVRRAGLDYWPLVDLHVHERYEDFATPHAGRIHMFASGGSRSYLDADFAPGDALVFGKESVGLPEAMLNQCNRVWGIPTIGGVRSLNLSNAVAIVVYEALRRTGGLNTPFMR